MYKRILLIFAFSMLNFAMGQNWGSPNYGAQQHQMHMQSFRAMQQQQQFMNNMMNNMGRSSYSRPPVGERYYVNPNGRLTSIIQAERENLKDLEFSLKQQKALLEKYTTKAATASKFNKKNLEKKAESAQNNIDTYNKKIEEIQAALEKDEAYLEQGLKKRPTESSQTPTPVTP